MNWELAEVERHRIFLPPGGLAWAIFFLCMAVVVVRRRPAALPFVWLVSSLLLVVSTFLWRWGSGALEYMLWIHLAEVVLLALVPSGLATLVLLALRNRPRFAGLPVQVLCATLALAAGVALSVVALVSTYRLFDPHG